MRKKLLLTYIAIVFITLLISGITFWTRGYQFVLQQSEDSYGTQTRLLADCFQTIDNLDPASAENFVKTYGESYQLRITLIAKDGSVIADSDEDLLDNHMNRAEVQGALQGEQVNVIRHSDTMNMRYFYSAIPVSHQGFEGVLRVSLPLDELSSLDHYLVYAVLMAFLLASVIAIIIGAIFSRYVTKPLYEVTNVATEITRGHYNVQIQNHYKDQIGVLADAINEMARVTDENINALTQQNIELKKLETMRSDFVSNVTHELKTPLTSIRGFVDTLRQGAVQDEKVAKRFLDIIDIEAERLYTLIQDILTLSEIESREDWERQSCDMNKVIFEVTEMLTPKLSENTRFVFKPMPYLKPFMCNEYRMKQLILNLVDNAVKHTEQGTITIKCYDENQELVLMVMDTGIGIAEEYLYRIFERFYRVDKGRSRKQGGTGLGLSIVKHIVEMYKGNIVVESEVGVGTCFTIKLPY